VRDLWRPRWAGGWEASRLLFALAAASAHLPRRGQIADALTYPEITFVTGFTHVADHALLGPAGAYGLWGLGLVGLAGLIAGGRAAKPGLALWLACYLALLAAMGLESRVPTRWLVMVSIGLLLGPIGERGLAARWRSPLGRWYFLVIFGAIYGSTGWLKLLAEPAWRDGSSLAYNLVDLEFGCRPLGVWVSDQPALLAVMAWWTILFEALFPLLALLRRTNPWILAAGACMHLGIESMMHVGTLTFTCLAMYPVLLEPDVAQRAWARVSARGGAAPPPPRPPQT